MPTGMPGTPLDQTEITWNDQDDDPDNEQWVADDLPGSEPDASDDDLPSDELAASDDESVSSPDGEQTSPDASDVSSNCDARELVDDVQVPLTFDVGEALVRVGQLRSLLPGYTFELSTPLDTPVAIKAYGQLVGHGQLVQVGERLGVRLTEIGRDAHH